MCRVLSKMNLVFPGTVIALLLLSAALPCRGQSYDVFLEPNKIVNISSPFNGRIDQINVRVGDRVVTGQILAELDTGVLKAQLELASKAAAFHGRIDSAKARVKMQKDRYAMLLALEKSGNARPQEMTRARTDLIIAKAELLSAREDQKLRELEADVIRARIEENRLRSPIDGIVVKVSKEQAELVGGADRQGFITIVQLNPLQALFHLPPAIVEKIRVGSDVEVEVDDKPVTAKIDYISPVINGQSGTVEVRIIIENGDNLLTSGQRCILRDSSILLQVANDTTEESKIDKPSG